VSGVGPLEPRRLADLPVAAVPIVEAELHALVGEWAHHDRNHAGRLLGIARARVWEQMAGAGRFVDPTA
jgi:hypothetical protein